MEDSSVSFAKSGSKMSKFRIMLSFIVVALIAFGDTSNDVYFGSNSLDDSATLNMQFIPNTALSYDSQWIVRLAEEVNPSNIESSCMAFLHLYAELASNFTKCAIIYARPLRFCEKCVDEFVMAKTVYDFIIKGDSHDLQGRPCGDVILNADRTQIVVQTNSYINTIWDDSDCKNCYELYHEHNGTVEVKMNNETLHFLDLMNQTQTCFDNFTKGEDVLPLGNHTVNHTICTACKPLYDELNRHYLYMEEHFHKKICMDVVDTMNYTRLMWSKTFLCSRHQGDLTAVLLLSCLFATLPVVFYVGNRIYGHRRQTMLLKQKRLRDTPAQSPNNVLSVNDPAVPGSSSESG